jgi:hypothetical protein
MQQKRMVEDEVRSVHRGPALAGTSEYDYEVRDYEGRAPRPQQTDRCGHRLLSVVPVVSIRVEEGYVGRCLLCGTTGPVRDDGEAARLVLFEQMIRAEH